MAESSAFSVQGSEFRFWFVVRVLVLGCRSGFSFWVLVLGSRSFKNKNPDENENPDENKNPDGNENPEP